MRQLFKFTMVLLAFIMGFAFVGCGFIQDDVEEVKETHFYEPGEAVGAAGYADALAIQLYQLAAGGSEGEKAAFQEVKNGDYVEKGVHRLGVQITATEGQEGQTDDQRVFISDGGWAYQVEALYDENSGLYVCDFEFFDASTYLTHPVLIQVITPAGIASKEKFVVTTYPGLRPGPDMLVEKGLGITLSSALLDSLKASLSGMFGGDDEGAIAIDIKEFRPAPYNEGEEGIFQMDAGIMSCDIALKDTYTNADGQEARGLSLELVNVSGGTPEPGDLVGFLVSILFSLFGETIVNNLNLSEQAVGPIALPLSDMMASMSGSDDNAGDGAEDDLMAGMMEDLQMDTTLFLNIYGMPEETDEDFAVIGAGIFGIDPKLVKDEVTPDPDNPGEEIKTPIWPTVELDTKDTGMNLDKIKDDETDLGIAISQYNLNHMLMEMMRGFKIEIEDIIAMGLPIPIAPSNPNNVLGIIITVNPFGVAINMKPDDRTGQSMGVFTINDMQVVFVEAGTPMAELSIDLNMGLDVSLGLENGAYLLELVLTPDFDRSYSHVMKDDLGLTTFDHSRFVQILFMGLTGSEDEGMVIPLAIPLTHKVGSNLQAVKFDQNGNCFMNMALESFDISLIPGCFITASGF